jgi:hypothetical protein
MMFKQGFDKAAKGFSSHTLDQIGLGALAVPAAIHTYKALKEKKPGEAALGGAEVAGLGILSRAAYKAHR